MKLLAPTVPIETTPAPQVSIQDLLAPAFACAENSASLVASRHPVTVRRQTEEIPKFLLLGQRGGGVPIRLGLFAGFDPGQLDTVAALTRLVLEVEATPALARDYALFAYPVVHARGFDAEPAPLSDFERRFAKNSADEDIQFFHTELLRWSFNGLISLRLDPTTTGLYAEVRSEVIARQVIAPALTEAATTLPLDVRPVRVRPADRYARAADYAAGRLAPPAEIRPYPFEVTFGAPVKAPSEDRIAAFGAAVTQLLRHYRKFIAHGADL